MRPPFAGKLRLISTRSADATPALLNEISDRHADTMGIGVFARAPRNAITMNRYRLTSARDPVCWPRRASRRKSSVSRHCRPPNVDLLPAGISIPLACQLAPRESRAPFRYSASLPDRLLAGLEYSVLAARRSNRMGRLVNAPKTSHQRIRCSAMMRRLVGLRQPHPAAR